MEIGYILLNRIFSSTRKTQENTVISKHLLTAQQA